MYQENLRLVWERATQQDRQDGRDWYPTALDRAQTIGRRHRVEAQRVVGVIAALSPGSDWDRNVGDASDAVSEYATGTTRQAFLRLPIGSYGRRNREKAFKILKGLDALEVLGGKKVRAFYQCIRNPQDEFTVCVDRHAKNAARGVISRDRESIVRPSEYEPIAEAYRAEALRVGVLPMVYQATVWTCWKRLHGNLDQGDLF